MNIKRDSHQAYASTDSVVSSETSAMFRSRRKITASGYVSCKRHDFRRSGYTLHNFTHLFRNLIAVLPLPMHVHRLLRLKRRNMKHQVPDTAQSRQRFRSSSECNSGNLISASSRYDSSDCALTKSTSDCHTRTDCQWIFQRTADFPPSHHPRRRFEIVPRLECSVP